jgi:hypothetical protein
MQTATESIDLRSIQEQLEHLKSGVSAIVDSEKALIKSRAERLLVVRREMTQREEVDAEKLTRRIHELAAVRQEAIDAAQAAKEVRSARIHQLYHNSRATLSHRLQAAKDRRIGLVQGSIMRNRQLRQDELEHATEAHQAFEILVAGDRDTRRTQRKSVHLAFRS